MLRISLGFPKRSGTIRITGDPGRCGASLEFPSQKAGVKFSDERDGRETSGGTFSETGNTRHVWGVSGHNDTVGSMVKGEILPLLIKICPRNTLPGPEPLYTHV